MNDYQLDQIAEDMAREILAEIAKHGGDASDLAHQTVDGCEHVIYHAKAHAIRQGCNTDNGKQFLADVGNPDPVTYLQVSAARVRYGWPSIDSLASIIAYGELLARVMLAIDEIEGDA
jgi:hypothetical protein